MRTTQSRDQKRVSHYRPLGKQRTAKHAELFLAFCFSVAMGNMDPQQSPSLASAPPPQLGSNSRKGSELLVRNEEQSQTWGQWEATKHRYLLSQRSTQQTTAAFHLASCSVRRSPPHPRHPLRRRTHKAQQAGGGARHTGRGGGGIGGAGGSPLSAHHTAAAVVAAVAAAVEARGHQVVP